MGIKMTLKGFVYPSILFFFLSFRSRSKEDNLDVFIYDSPVIDYRMANDPDCSLVSVGKPFGEEGYGIGVSKGKTSITFSPKNNT